MRSKMYRSIAAVVVTCMSLGCTVTTHERQVMPTNIAAEEPTMETSRGRVVDSTTYDPSRPTVADLKQGEPAPFEGTLFNPTATAIVIAKMEAVDRIVANEVARVEARSAARLRLRESELQAEVDAERQKRTMQVNLRDDEINQLQEELSRTSSPNYLLWVSLGVGGGVAATLATVFIVSQVRR